MWGRVGFEFKRSQNSNPRRVGAERTNVLLRRDRLGRRCGPLERSTKLLEASAKHVRDVSRHA